MSKLLFHINDTLTKNPEYGIFSSFLTITISATEFLQLAGVVLGLFIAVITAILKVIELRDKLKAKKKVKRSRGKRVNSSDFEDPEDYIANS